MADEQGGTRWLPIVLGVLVLLGVGWWFVGQDDAATGEPDANAEEANAGAASALAARGLPPALALDPLADERASIAGTIFDESRKPIAGAKVCAWVRSERVSTMDSRRPTCVDSEPDGHYRIDGLFAVDHGVTASAPEYAPGTYETESARGFPKTTVHLRPGGLAEGIDIVLGSGGVPVRGIVKDIAGGEIEGALVRATRGDGWWGNQSEISVAWTDGSGEFELWVEPGTVGLNAMVEGYADGSRSGVAPGQYFELFLTPESVIVGKVVKAQTGEPVAGVQVGRQGWRWGSASDTATTNEQGEFRIDGLEPGTYKLRASGPEVYGLAAETVHLGLGQTSAPVTIEVHDAYYVEGRVVMSDGEPCVESSVQLHDREADRQTWEESDDSGTVIAEALLPGTYDVEVRCRGMLSLDEYEPIVIEDSSVTGLVWQVREGLAIRGVVVDSTGNPLEKMRVSAQMVGSDDPRAKSSDAWGQETDATGQFELAGLKPGTYRLGVWGDMPDPEKPVEVELDKSDINDARIEIPAVGTIAGTVRDPQGTPVGGARVRTQANRWGGNSGWTADDGTFTIENIEVGEHRVIASRGWNNEMRAPGSSDDDVQGERVVVEVGETANVDLVVESETGKITGRVVDEQGKVVADAFIDAEREKDSAAAREGSAARRVRRGWRGSSTQPVLTDQEGRFELVELAAGRYSVRAFRKGGGDAILESVELGTDVELVIEATGELSGRVAYAGGGTPDEFELSVSDKKAGYYHSETYFRSGGAWRVTQVPAGDFELTVEAARGSAKAEARLEEGESKDGITIELVAKVTVRGTVVDLETSEPVPGMRVSVSKGRGISFGVDSGERKEITDAAGRYEVDRAPTGEVQLTVMPKNWMGSDYGWTFKPIRLPAEPEVQELAPVRLAKKRLEDGERGGDLGYTLKEWDPEAEHGERKHEVAFIRPDGPAAKSGLEPGDVIESVDGTTVTGEDYYLYWSLSQVPAGTKVSIGVARGESFSIVADKPL